MERETGKLLRRERIRRGWTQEDLSQLLHVAMRTVRNWERSGVPEDRYDLVRDTLDLDLEQPQAQQPPTSQEALVHSGESSEPTEENVAFVIGLPVKKADLGQAELEEIEAGTRAVALRLLREIRSKP